MMRALVIRSAERAAETARRLEACGIEAVPLPLSEPVSTGASLPGEAFDGIILTSRNAAPFLGDSRVSRLLPVFAVGEASAAAARDLGFADVRTGNGDAAALAGLIAKTCRQQQGGRRIRLLYPAAVQRAFAMKEALHRDGIDTLLVEAYRMKRIDPGREVLAAALTKTANGLHLFHSALSAAHFTELTSRYGLDRMLGGVTALAISDKTSHRLPMEQYRQVIVVKSPDEDAMIALAAEFARKPGE